MELEKLQQIIAEVLNVDDFGSDAGEPPLPRIWEQILWICIRLFWE